jgi:hypothetical protein
MTKQTTKKDRKEAAVKAGRMALATWLHKAEKHGTIYYAIEQVSRSGMSRQIVLSTIVKDKNRKLSLQRLWPSIPWPSGASIEDHNEALDFVAADWGFSFKTRNFVIGGCGMDMVFALVDRLASLSGLEGRGAESYANRVRREAF